MKISVFKIYGQLYVTPFVMVTHDRTLNGDLELIVGWLKWSIVIAI